jgi:hypothetical protein
VSVLLAVACTDDVRARLLLLGPCFLVLGIVGLLLPARWHEAMARHRRALLAWRAPSARALVFERRLSRGTCMLMALTGVGQLLLAATC